MGGEVVWGRFPGSAAEPKILSGTRIPEGTLTRESSRKLLLADFLYYQENRRRVGQAEGQADMMAEVVCKLPGFVPLSADRPQKELLGRISLEELCRFLIEDSREKEWKAQPVYYGVLVQAFAERMDMLRRVEAYLARHRGG